MNGAFVRHRAARATRRGFSLLEVMVAVTILGLVLTVVLSAQGGLSASNRSAARGALAVQLARCKMTEVEEKLYKQGYPEIDQIDTETPCCEDTQTEGYKCDTRIEKVELPPPPSSGGGGDAGLDLSSPKGIAGLAGAAGLGGGATAGAAGAAGLAGAGGLAGAAGALGGLGGGSTAGLSLDGGMGQIGSVLNQQVGGGGAAGLLSMVMGMVYPSMKVLMEASIRRVTIVVKWRDGSVPREFTITQYVTNPQRGFTPIPGMPMGADGGVP